MLNMLNPTFRILAVGPNAAAEGIFHLKQHFTQVPTELVHLMEEATELELQHANGQYIRIWGPSGCVEMDEAYGIRQRIPSAIPIGDDGGGHFIFYGHGRKGFGLYHVGYGNIDADDAIWMAPALSDLLVKTTGIETF